jgi:hypothetical protein
MKKHYSLLLGFFLVMSIYMTPAFALPITVSTGDLGNNVINNAGLFQVNFTAQTPSNTIASSLNIKFGLWNEPEVEVSVFFNNTLLGSILADQGYIEPGPEFADFVVTGLLIDGLNIVTFNGFGDGGDYVIGQVNLNYDNSGTAPVPEPATILLLGAGLIGLIGYGRKKPN